MLAPNLVSLLILLRTVSGLLIISPSSLFPLLSLGLGFRRTRFLRSLQELPLRAATAANAAGSTGRSPVPASRSHIRFISFVYKFNFCIKKWGLL